MTESTDDRPERQTTCMPRQVLVAIIVEALIIGALVAWVVTATSS